MKILDILKLTKGGHIRHEDGANFTVVKQQGAELLTQGPVAFQDYIKALTLVGTGIRAVTVNAEGVLDDAEFLPGRLAGDYTPQTGAVVANDTHATAIAKLDYKVGNISTTIATLTGLTTNHESRISALEAGVTAASGAIYQGGNTLGTAVRIGTNDDHPLQFEVYNTVRAQINSLGTLIVGPDTSDPGTYKLLVNGNAYVSEDLYVGNMAGYGTRTLTVDNNGKLQVGGSGAIIENLGDLIDVITTSPVTGHILSYDGTNWVNTVSTTGAENGLTRNATTGKLKLGGNLTEATTINVTGTNIFSIQDPSGNGNIQMYGPDLGSGYAMFLGSFNNGSTGVSFQFSHTGFSMADLVSGKNPIQVTNSNVYMSSLEGTGTRMVTVTNLGKLQTQALPTATPPGGPTNAIQYNNAGVFAGSANLIWNGTGLVASRTTAVDGVYDIISATGTTGAGVVLGYEYVGANAHSRLFFDYTGNNNGGFGSRLAGVRQLFFGLGNHATYGGTTGTDSGRFMGIWDWVASVWRWGMGPDGTMYWGSSNTSFGAKIAQDGTAIFGAGADTGHRLQVNGDSLLNSSNNLIYGWVNSVYSLRATMGANDEGLVIERIASSSTHGVVLKSAGYGKVGIFQFEGGTANIRIGNVTASVHPAYYGVEFWAGNANKMFLASTGNLSVYSLAGTDDRMVVADSTGMLKTQAIEKPVTTVSSNTTATSGAYIVNTTSGNIVFTINPATLFSSNTSRWIPVKKGTNDSNKVIITPSSGTINGLATYELKAYNESVIILTDGTNLHIF